MAKLTKSTCTSIRFEEYMLADNNGDLFVGKVMVLPKEFWLNTYDFGKSAGLAETVRPSEHIRNGMIRLINCVPGKKTTSVSIPAALVVRIEVTTRLEKA